jgi:hypothetical protein
MNKPTVGDSVVIQGRSWNKPYYISNTEIRGVLVDIGSLGLAKVRFTDDGKTRQVPYRKLKKAQP